eukprot:scaffold2297_cov102-Isochrysis_galbana.AAC.7
MGWDLQLSAFELHSKRAFQCYSNAPESTFPDAREAKALRTPLGAVGCGCGLRTAAGAECNTNIIFVQIRIIH